jgi:hypothetical protein
MKVTVPAFFLLAGICAAIIVSGSNDEQPNAGVTSPRAISGDKSSTSSQIGEQLLTGSGDITSDDSSELILAPPGALAELFNSVSGAAPKASVDTVTHQAVALLRQAAESNDKEIYKQIGALPKGCRGCAEFFEQTRGILADKGLPYDQRLFFAGALAASGAPSNQSFLLGEIRKAANDPAGADVSAAALARQLERQQQGGPISDEVIDELSNDLSEENPYLRDAALSILTRQGSLQAAQSLYSYTIENQDRDGFYRQGMGLGHITPSQEAFPFLRDLVRRRDQYSHLAVKALLNAGQDGISEVISLLSEVEGAKPDKGLLQNAVDHVPVYGAALRQMDNLRGSANPTVRELAQQVVREHQSQINALRKEIEYNEFYESGIKLDAPRSEY